jgi:NTP pyrophosphatase (non-canonical NTP hydrolase)
MHQLRDELSVCLLRAGENIQETKIEKGWTVTGPEAWDQENQIPADLSLVHSEVSEALEAFRCGDRDKFAQELADVLIRVVGLAHGLGIDIGQEMADKMNVNRAREHRHGGKKI